MTSRWHSGSGWVWRALSDGGLFLVDTGTGDHLGVNHPAARFFELAAAGEPLDAIVERFAARYAVEREQVRADLAAIAHDLERVGALQPAPGESDVPGA